MCFSIHRIGLLHDLWRILMRKGCVLTQWVIYANHWMVLQNAQSRDAEFSRQGSNCSSLK